MLRSVHREVACELIEKVTPYEAIAAVKENQRLPLSSHFDVSGDFVFPETNRSF